MTVYESKSEITYFPRHVLFRWPCVIQSTIAVYNLPPFWLLMYRCCKQLETVRTLAHCASSLSQKGDKEASGFLSERMADELKGLPLDEAVPLTRACGKRMTNMLSCAGLWHVKLLLTLAV